MTPAHQSPLTELTSDSVSGVHGWFYEIDRVLFRWFLAEQASGPLGDLAELGVYLGKSAVLLGEYLRPEERFTVIDLFEDEAMDEANRNENSKFYPSFTQQAFEANYMRHRGSIPTIVRGPSQEILQHVSLNSVRFMHVDASHMYEHVRADLASSRLLLKDQGVVVFDDFRATHSPGVGAAVWQEVTGGELNVIAVTDQKLYATWSDVGPWREKLVSWLAEGQLGWEEQVVASQTLVRVWVKDPIRDSALKALTPPLFLPFARRLRDRVGRARRSR